MHSSSSVGAKIESTSCGKVWITYRLTDVGENALNRKKNKTREIYGTRMWANAQPDGRPPDIGGAFCSTPQSLADAHY